MSAQWLTLDRGGSPTGPVSAEEIVAKIAKHEVSRDAQICRAGETRWAPIIQVEQFAKAFAEAPPAPLPPPPQLPRNMMPSIPPSAAPPPSASALPPSAPPSSPALPPSAPPPALLALPP